MPLNITDFISHIKRNNVARPNRFDVVFTLPSSLVNYLSDTDQAKSSKSTGISISKNPVGTERMISLSCLSADIPAVGALTTDVTNGNYARRVVHDRNVNDFHTTFIVTGEMNEKRLFDAWQAIMFKQDNHRVAYYDDYVTSISVECHNNADKTVYHFELTEAYPVNVNVITLDRTSQNTQMMLDISWAFHKIKLDPNKYDVNTVATVDSATLRQITQSNSVTAAQLNLPVVPNTNFAKVEINDILKAAKRISDQVARGEMDPKNALRLITQLTKDFAALTGVNTNDFNVVSKFLTDLGAGMPIKVPGLGSVPTRLPF